jgi:anti-anti-sigma factor
MQIEHQPMETYDLVAITGAVDSASLPELEIVLQRIIQSGRYNIVVDLEHCSFIGSAGLQALLSTAQTCRRWERGDVYLCAVPPYIANLLQISGLAAPATESGFQIYETPAQAARALVQGSPKPE